MLNALIAWWAAFEFTDVALALKDNFPKWKLTKITSGNSDSYAQSFLIRPFFWHLLVSNPPKFFQKIKKDIYILFNELQNMLIST